MYLGGIRIDLREGNGCYGRIRTRRESDTDIARTIMGVSVDSIASDRFDTIRTADECDAIRRTGGEESWRDDLYGLRADVVGDFCIEDSTAL